MIRGPTGAQGSVRRLASNSEQRCDEVCLGSDVTATDISNLPLPDHCHRLIARRPASLPELVNVTTPDAFM